jgi:hypothetical protein
MQAPGTDVRTLAMPLNKSQLLGSSLKARGSSQQVLARPFFSLPLPSRHECRRFSHDFLEKSEQSRPTYKKKQLPRSKIHPAKVYSSTVCQFWLTFFLFLTQNIETHPSVWQKTYNFCQLEKILLTTCKYSCPYSAWHRRFSGWEVS